MTDSDIAGLADLWRWCAEGGFIDSPLYSAIGRGVADDPELIGLTVAAGSPQARIPHALMAAVHELALLGRAPALAEVYAGRSTEDPFPLFRAAALEHRDSIVDRLATRFTNTNEVGRCSLIVPAVAHVTAAWDRWALVDAGCSAGVNLCFDRYRLDYGPSGAVGDPLSPVRVDCEDRSGRLPVPTVMPVPDVRVGIDRNPIELGDADERRWLLACTWPDTGRLDRTAAAHAVVVGDPPRLVRGDIVDDLPVLLGTAAQGLPVVVVTTLVVAYLTPEQRRDLDVVLADASRRAPVTWVSVEVGGTVELYSVWGDDTNVVGAVRYEDGRRSGATVLGRSDAFGRWFEWTAGDRAAPAS